MIDVKLMTDVMSGWIGATTGSKMHKTILSIYNGFDKLPRGYKLKTTDAWCAATVSSAAIACGYTEDYPIECSCGKMIEIAKKKGIWIEDDSYIPAEGDLIIYAWGDDGKGDNTTGHDHVGYIKDCTGGMIYTIEGNYNSACRERAIKVNSRYIRGFIHPDSINDDRIGIFKTYVAVKGDTVTKVANRFKMSKELFININNLKYPYWLYSGHKYFVR